MSDKRKQHSSQFKAEVALEARGANPQKLMRASKPRSMSCTGRLGN